MSTPVHFSDDPQRNRHEWRRYIDEIDGEIAAEKCSEAIEQRRLEAENRRRWRSLPPVRLRPGTKRTTEQEDAYLDRSGY
jgi:hypothetical protein